MKKKLIELKNYFQKKEKPVFPIKAKSIMEKFDIKEGRVLGQKLKNLEHIYNLNQNFFQYYIEYNNERTFEKGLFQPFYLLQMYFQYVISIPLFVYIQNLIIVFLSHYLFLKGLNNFISVNYSLALLIFLSYFYFFLIPVPHLNLRHLNKKYFYSPEN